MNSVEIILTLVSILGIVSFLSWGLTFYRENNPEKLAKVQALGIGYFVWELELHKKLSPLPSPVESSETQVSPIDTLDKKTPQRGLATVEEEEIDSDKTTGSISEPSSIFRGSMGTDPWGRPFHYEIRRDKGLLYVWSMGANGHSDSFINNNTFSGDDLGQVLDLTNGQ